MTHKWIWMMWLANITTAIMKSVQIVPTQTLKQINKITSKTQKIIEKRKNLKDEYHSNKIRMA